VYQNAIQSQFRALLHSGYVFTRWHHESTFNRILDPESLSWDLFDDEYRKKLDNRPYVSLSGDRRSSAKTETRVGDINNPAESKDQQNTTSIPSHDLTGNPPGSGKSANLDNLEEDSQSDSEDVDIPEGSLFNYNIPGVLKRDEVEKLDLNHWKLVVRNSMVDLEVSRLMSDIPQGRITDVFLGSPRLE
jgi:arginyl-tRNA---protein transferase